MGYSMRNESVGVVDLRRKLSALLETTRQQPLMVHRYGTPWACVVSDAQWQQHRAALEFDPGRHPLARLQKLQRQHLPLSEQGMFSPAAAARALIVHAIYRFDDLGELQEQLHYDRLLHWFVDAGGVAAGQWSLSVLRSGIVPLLDAAGNAEALSAFLARADVSDLGRACGGVPREGRIAFRRMTG